MRNDGWEKIVVPLPTKVFGDNQKILLSLAMTMDY